MIPIILNKNFEVIDHLTKFKSLEWVRRYQDYGDFVLNVLATDKNIENIQPDYYLVREDDDMILIIENMIVNTSNEGDFLEVKGRSIEQILDRRIIWNQTNSKTNETAEDFIRRLVDENCINPANLNRKIPNLKLGSRKGFTEKINIQITGESLFVAIKEICVALGYGFKITMNSSRELEFEVYKGTDRSYNQSINPYVEFSEKFGNLINSEYVFDKTPFKNIALVGGEGEGKERKYKTVGEETSGFERYELFVDGKDISSNEGEISNSDYLLLLNERGIEKLGEAEIIETFSGTVENNRIYTYKKHYFIGDTVQIKNKYNISATSRVTEMIESQNTNGYRAVPTFSSWEV